MPSTTLSSACAAIPRTSKKPKAARDSVRTVNAEPEPAQVCCLTPVICLKILCSIRSLSRDLQNIRLKAPAEASNDVIAAPKRTTDQHEAKKRKRAHVTSGADALPTHSTGKKQKATSHKQHTSTARVPYTPKATAAEATADDLCPVAAHTTVPATGRCDPIATAPGQHKAGKKRPRAVSTAEPQNGGAGVAPGSLAAASRPSPARSSGQDPARPDSARPPDSGCRQRGEPAPAPSAAGCPRAARQTQKKRDVPNGQPRKSAAGVGGAAAGGGSPMAAGAPPPGGSHAGLLRAARDRRSPTPRRKQATPRRFSAAAAPPAATAVTRSPQAGGMRSLQQKRCGA